MLGRIIEASARNLFLVLLLTAFVIAGGVYAVLHTPLDALPDLSDTQVIIFDIQHCEEPIARWKFMQLAK